MENSPLQAAIIGAGNGVGPRPALERGHGDNQARHSPLDGERIGSCLRQQATMSKPLPTPVVPTATSILSLWLPPTRQLSHWPAPRPDHRQYGSTPRKRRHHGPRCGIATLRVIYPMQTFTRGVAADLSDAPIFIDAASPELADLLTRIALTVSANVRPADSAARRRLHCAAVFACNFTNHLWDIADGVARRAGVVDCRLHAPHRRKTLRKAKGL